MEIKTPSFILLPLLTGLGPLTSSHGVLTCNINGGGKRLFVCFLRVVRIKRNRVELKSGRKSENKGFEILSLMCIEYRVFHLG